MTSKKVKKRIVLFVLLITGFSLMFGSFIMLLGGDQVIVKDQTTKTGKTVEETDVYKNMVEEIEKQNKEGALALTGHNNIFKEDKINKLEDLNISLEKLDDVENSTKMNKEKIIEKFNQSSLLKKYDIDSEQLYYFLYEVDGLNLEIKDIRKLGKKFEDMQKDQEYKNDFKKIRDEIEKINN